MLLLHAAGSELQEKHASTMRASLQEAQWLDNAS